MNFRQKLMYTTYGALIAFTGMWVASSGVQSVTAERETDIVCTSLKVVNEAGETVVSLASSPDGGLMVLGDKTGMSRMFLVQSETLGALVMHDKKDNIGASLMLGQNGGMLNIFDKAGKAGVILDHESGVG